MGQAKRRGTPEQRAEQAKARVEALKPAFIVCNECKGEIRDVQVMDSRGLQGIEAVFGGLCPTCNSTTYAIKGSSDAVADVMVALEESSGGPCLVGSQGIKAP